MPTLPKQSLVSWLQDAATPIEDTAIKWITPVSAASPLSSIKKYVRVCVMKDSEVAQAVINALKWKGCKEAANGYCDTPLSIDCQVVGIQNNRYCYCPCHIG